MRLRWLAVYFVVLLVVVAVVFTFSLQFEAGAAGPIGNRWA